MRLCKGELVIENQTKLRGSRLRPGSPEAKSQLDSLPTWLLVWVHVPSAYCLKVRSIGGCIPPRSPWLSSLLGSGVIYPSSDLWFTSEALPGKPAIWLAAWWSYWTVTGWDNYALSCRLAIRRLGLECDLWRVQNCHRRQKLLTLEPPDS